MEGAKACETLLRTRMACPPTHKTPKCPFSGKTHVPIEMIKTEQDSKVKERQHCPFSGKSASPKDDAFEQSDGYGQNMKERLAKLPDIEDNMSQRRNGSKLTTGLCSLCPLAKVPPQERSKQQNECPLKFDDQGNVIRNQKAAGSAAGPAPKCPIRSLDHHSPEEVAKYFEEHKREIPRSHEICIKRYRSNSESIKQLDAKYGSLVNMIEGLGAKHQPFLPDTEEKVCFTGEAQNDTNTIEHWASEVGDKGATDPEVLESDDRRRSHFDRPLKDIRVGESPSRPWGISVPVADAILTDDSREEPSHKTEKTHIGNEFMGENSHHPRSNSYTPNATNQHAQKESAPRVIFHGPVFIGYPPDKAAAFFKQLGLSGQPSIP